MSRVPFHVLNLEVVKLYEKPFESSEVEAINKHCEYITDFIRAAGWTEEDFIRAMFGFDDHLTN